MDKFLIQKATGSKHKETNNDDDTEATSTKKSKITYRKYDDKYIALGFSWTGDKNCTIPIFGVCDDKLSNALMVPNKLQRHLDTKHPNLKSKTPDYFKTLLKSSHKQAESFTKYMKTSSKAQKCSFLVAELIAQKRNLTLLLKI